MPCKYNEQARNTLSAQHVDGIANASTCRMASSSYQGILCARYPR